MEFDLENPLPTTSTDMLFPFLFHIETHHMPSSNYLRTLNSSPTSALSSTRSHIVSSIFHFSCNLDDPFLSYLAVNYMDRFLSTHSIPELKPWILKLVAVSCISLAFKMMSCSNADNHSSVPLLLNESGIMVDSVAIQRMEMVILGALKWRMRSVNPFAFANYFLSFLKVQLKEKSSIHALKSRATEIILNAQTDVKVLDFRSSVVSASAILCAANQLFPTQAVASFRDTLCRCCSYLDKEKLLHCYDLMEDCELASRSCSSPGNVLDLHCFSSSISISISISISQDDREVTMQQLQSNKK